MLRTSVVTEAITHSPTHVPHPLAPTPDYTHPLPGTYIRLTEEESLHAFTPT